MSSLGAQFEGWLELDTTDSGDSYVQTDAQAGTGHSVRTGAQSSAQVNERITALVEQYSSVLYRVAYSVTRNSAEAEDAVQETFLRVMRHQDRLEEIRDIRVWLVRITWNLVLDRKRRAKTRPENEDIDHVARLLTSPELSADKRVIAAQRHARVLQLIDKLPLKEKQVVLLSAFEEFSTAQIAAVAAITESSVRSRLFRARKLLSAMLEQDAASREGSLL